LNSKPKQLLKKRSRPDLLKNEARALLRQELERELDREVSKVFDLASLQKFSRTVNRFSSIEKS
jgi:hypothetical protein